MEHKRIREPMEGQHRLSLAEDPVTLCKFSPVVRNISKAIFDWSFKEPSKPAKIIKKKYHGKCSLIKFDWYLVLNPTGAFCVWVHVRLPFKLITNRWAWELVPKRLAGCQMPSCRGGIHGNPGMREPPNQNPSPGAWRKEEPRTGVTLSLIHIWRCRRSTLCRSRWSPYH